VEEKRREEKRREEKRREEKRRQLRTDNCINGTVPFCNS
jgi:hypothetical protein